MSPTGEEISAYMDSHSKVDLICVLTGLALIYDHCHGDPFAEVIHNKCCDDFLYDIFNFFCMEVSHAYGILELSEGGLNAPTHMVEFLYFINGKSLA